MRTVLAKSAIDLLKGGADPQAAAQAAVRLLADKTASTGGIILVGRRGKVGYARNTTHMPVCAITGSGQLLLEC
jgi:beta-aspartyl-peptidase (threonine type)